MAHPISFTLAAELVGHEGPVRAIAFLPEGQIVTGSQDNTAKVWTSVKLGNSNFYEILETLKGHTRWVTSALYLPKNTFPECAEGGIITGCLDKLIRIFNMRGELVKVLEGHEGGVISLCLENSLSRSKLLSGSWDGTARVWDLNSDCSCVGVLPNHENGVTVLSLPNGNIATASTGKQEGGRVVDAQIRLWSADGTLLKSLKNHEGPVRDLDLIENLGFLSTSNDGTARIWSMDGDAMAVMHHPIGREGQPSFVLSGCSLSNGECVTVDETGHCIIWRDCQAIQTIQHPSSLWVVKALPNGDFITACQDHIARIFTRSPERLAGADAIQNFERAVQEAQIKATKGPSDLEVSKLPVWANRHDHYGKSDGQVQVFQRDGKAIAAQWSAASGSWVEVGEVTGSADSEELDGSTYDHVIPVEIEGHDGSVKTLKCGYNNGDNPFTVAQAFIDKHMLPQAYLSEVADHLSKVAGRSPHVIGTSESQSTFSGVGDPTGFANSTGIQYGGGNLSKKVSKHFPPDVYAIFDAGDISKIEAKIISFNVEVDPSMSLSENELNTFSQLCNVIKAVNRYHASRVTAIQIRTIVKLFQWPPDKIFPVFDLCRILVLHPHAAEMMGKSDFEGDRMYNIALQNIVESIPGAAVLCSLRFLSNSLKAKSLRDFVLNRSASILDSAACRLTGMYSSKPIRLSIGTLLMNMSLASSQSNERFELQQLVAVIVEMVASHKEIEDDALYRSLIGLGTLLSYSAEAKTTAKDLDAKDAIQSICASNKSQSVIECAADVGKLLL